VDAICINQSPDGREEKSAQLPPMRDIYAKPKGMYDWLGLDTASSIYAMEWSQGASLGKYPLSGGEIQEISGEYAISQ
jgi:Heterokaryon incompatibility protein (HET)